MNGFIKKHTKKNKENDIMEVMIIGEREMLQKQVSSNLFLLKTFLGEKYV